VIAQGETQSGKGPEFPVSIRLDLFLKHSRIIPRRRLAHQACQHGGIRVNGQTARPGKTIKPGDLIEWIQPHKRIQVRVLKVPVAPPGKKDAPTLFEVVKVDWFSENAQS
jgi:ribosomal 50S subunit-recycling heat shock protein